MAATAAASSAPGPCSAGTACLGCARTVVVIGPDIDTCLRQLQEAVAAEGWGRDAKGRRRCPACAAEPKDDA